MENAHNLRTIGGGLDHAGRIKPPDSPWPFAMSRHEGAQIWCCTVACRDWDDAIVIAARNGWELGGPIMASGTVPRWMPWWLFIWWMNRKARRAQKGGRI